MRWPRQGQVSGFDDGPAPHGPRVDDQETSPLTQTNVPVSVVAQFGRRGTRLWLAIGIVVVLVTSTGAFVARDHLWGVRAEARAAIEDLREGDLEGLGVRLAANRGHSDFAYFFASAATPRDLGDALGAVAGDSPAKPLKPGVDADDYDLLLTDLAGSVALASHGTGHRALPETWTREFIMAATTPLELYGESGGIFDRGGRKRERQDLANKANLQLLLSRGYWSAAFLREVTTRYTEFDRVAGDDAWPSADPDEEVGFAPAPNGVYLTDGMLALSAALTANPRASAWAFSEFQPGRVSVAGSDQTVGRFTHHLLFEHRFPTGADGTNVGMTAVLTALSSAIESADSVVAPPGAAQPPTPNSGPTQDSWALQAIAAEIAAQRGCSFNPRDYGRCVVAAARAVWSWVQRWGHTVLDILTLATLAPPPFNAIGITAAATNATWHAIEGDYVRAGLSLAAAAPGLALGKALRTTGAAKGSATGSGGTSASTMHRRVHEAARAWRPLKPWRDCDLLPPDGLRLRHGNDWTRAQRRAADDKVKRMWEAAQKEPLKKTLVARSGSASSAYRKSTGQDVPPGRDVDHTVDLQLGGADVAANMQVLDPTVNRSLGRQVEAQLRRLNYGDPISSVAIC